MRSAGGGQAEVRIQPRQALRLRAGRDRADRDSRRLSTGLRGHGRQHLGQDDAAGFSGQDRGAIRQRQTTWVMDRGIPTEEVLAEMRASQTPIHYLVGTPRGRLTKLEKALAAKPWEDVRESVRVKLIEQEQETYVFARSQARREKEQAMRRRRLRKLIKRLRELQGQNLTRDELLLKLGAAKKEAGKAYGLLTIHTPTKDQPVTPQTFHFALDRKKLRIARRREGGYLLRSKIRGDDPGHLWRLYLRLVEIEQAFKELKNDLSIRPIHHQLEDRIEAHIFVAFLADGLMVTLKQRLKALAPGLTPRAVLEKLAAIQMIDVELPTTDGRTVVLARHTEPENDHLLLLQRLKLAPPPPPPAKNHGPAPPPGRLNPHSLCSADLWTRARAIPKASPRQNPPVGEVGLAFNDGDYVDNDEKPVLRRAAPI